MSLSQSFKIGFIGAGKMGGAIIKGLISAGHPSENIIVSEKSKSTIDNLVNNYHVKNVQKSTDVASISDAVIVAVHPNQFTDVLEEIKSSITNKKTVISVAGGLQCKTLESHLGSPVVRVMPNICAEVCESVSAITSNTNTPNSNINIAESIFNMVGQTIHIKEDLFDAFSGVAGCGLAFVFPIIEAMADGAVLEGIDRSTAIRLAAQTVAGAGKLAVVTGKHPGPLKDDVCSPGGCTIEGVKTIEEHGVRAAYINAVISAVEKSKRMANQ